MCLTVNATPKVLLQFLYQDSINHLIIIMRRLPHHSNLVCANPQEQCGNQRF